MLHNALRPVSSVSLRRSNAGCQSCAVPLESPAFRDHLREDGQNFGRHSCYFLTCRPPSASMFLVSQKAAGSNLHRLVVFVFRFCPTKR
jgi:hypothetical protein